MVANKLSRDRKTNEEDYDGTRFYPDCFRTGE